MYFVTRLLAELPEDTAGRKTNQKFHEKYIILKNIK